MGGLRTFAYTGIPRNGSLLALHVLYAGPQLPTPQPRHGSSLGPSLQVRSYSRARSALNSNNLQVSTPRQILSPRARSVLAPT